MNPEPLKNKLYKIPTCRVGAIDKLVGDAMDIRKAVDWYRFAKNKGSKTYEELFEEWQIENISMRTDLSFNDWLLNKAFEDVMK